VIAVIVVKDGRDLVELVEDFVVARHVGGQDAADDALPHALVHLAAERGEQVGRWLLQNIERHRAVVILQWRYVVVAQRQLRPRVDLFIRYRSNGMDWIWISARNHSQSLLFIF